MRAAPFETRSDVIGGALISGMLATKSPALLPNAYVPPGIKLKFSVEAGSTDRCGCEQAANLACAASIDIGSNPSH